MTLLEVRNLKTHYSLPKHTLRVLDDFSLAINEGEGVGLVGESGCGKSTVGASIMRLVQPPGRVVGGQVLLNGRDLLSLTERQMQEVRGSEIAMIFQNPKECLNPVVKVGKQIQLVYQAHRKIGRAEANRQAIENLRALGLPRPDKILKSYPHELSGGMCQRVMIALAIAGNPKLLIADEATTALDVTVQLQLAELLKALRLERALSQLVVSHDLGVVAELCSRVYVMYCGQIVEAAPTEALFEDPVHPYTRGLVKARPRVGHTIVPDTIPGGVPEFSALPRGCRFHPRCAEVELECRVSGPSLVELYQGHFVRCLLPKADNGAVESYEPAQELQH